MEPAKINWKAIESVYVRDETYENISAPKWVDFLAPDDAGVYAEDEAWFCRSDCKHPKTAEDFLRSTPTAKLLRSASVSKLIGLGDWDWNWTSSREVNNPKIRGRIECLSGGGGEDGENQNPNLATPPQSSATVNEEEDNNSLMLKPEENRRLKSTLSARDLFGGGGGRGLIIVNKITEFCNELKRMATISTSTTTKQMLQQQEETMKAKDTQVEDELLILGNNNETVKREEIAAGEDNHKKKPRFVDTENVPVVNVVPLKLDLKKKKNSSREIIRTSPPTPQCFSATTSNKPTQSSSSLRIPKSTRLLLKERQPFKELVLEHMTTTPTKPKQVEQEHEPEGEEEEELVKSNNVKKKKKNNSSSSCTSGFASKEGRAALVDVFWLFKPCALSSSS